MAAATGGRIPGDAGRSRARRAWRPFVGAALASLTGAAAAGLAVTAAGPGDDGGSNPGLRLLTVGNRAAAIPGPGVLPQVRAGTSDPHFEVWCGSARGIPDLLEADSFVIQWGDPVAPGDLPLTAYAKDIAPKVQVTDEYGGYVVPGATGDEQWTEATVYCMDPYGMPIAALPAVLDQRLYGS